MSQDFKQPTGQMGEPYKPPTTNKSNGKTSGKAIASLVLGLLSLVGACLTGIPGLILGILGLNEINRSGGRVGGKGIAIFGIVLSGLGILWTVMLLIGLMLPGVIAVRGAARRTTSMNNMKQQTLGMLNYESSYMKFPPRDENGLSWRVHILPFIGRADLYQRFNLDEPWDSVHNLTLLEEMPFVYDSPSVDLPPGYTVYQVPYTDIATNPASQDRALFDTSGEAITWGKISDGSSNTVALMEVDAAAAVEWTKPSDWEYDPLAPKHDLGDVYPGIFLINMADGSVRSIPANISPEDMKAMITREAGDQAVGY